MPNVRAMLARMARSLHREQLYSIGSGQAIANAGASRASMRRSRYGALGDALAGLTCLAAVGCESPPPDAVANHPMPGDVPGATTTLDEEGLASLRSVLRQSVPPGFTPLAPSALGQRRWSDLSGAVGSALLANGAAVVHEQVGTDAATFTFKTTDGRRGSVHVIRVPQPTLVSVKAQVDAAVPAAELEGAIVEAVAANLDAASKRRTLEDY